MVIFVVTFMLSLSCRLFTIIYMKQTAFFRVGSAAAVLYVWLLLHAEIYFVFLH